MSGGFAQCDSSWVVKTDYSFFLWVISWYEDFKFT